MGAHSLLLCLLLPRSGCCPAPSLHWVLWADVAQEEELLRITKRLDNIVARMHTEGALDLLKKLNSFQMSDQLFQTTRLGVAVSRLCKHCSEKEVATWAKVLIKNQQQLLDSPG